MPNRKRQPARNLRELYNNLNPLEFLTKENEQFYVEIYAEVVANMRREILWDDDLRQTIYVTGQTGSGKTTTLNFLPNTDIEAEFHVLKFEGNMLLDLTDLNSIDLLLMLAYNLVVDDADLSNKYLELLGELQGRHDGSLEVIEEEEETKTQDEGGGAKVGFGAKFLSFLELGMDFFSNYRSSSEQRKITRRALQFRKNDLLNLVNEIIREYSLKYAADKKGLLVIFNELDDVKNWATIQQMFLSSNRQLLERLACKKVVSVPVILKTRARGDMSIYFLGTKSPNPAMVGGEGPVLDEQHFKNLHTIISKRIDPLAQLISEEALTSAILQSGGIIRQMVRILREAILRSPEGAISLSLADVERGAESFRKNLADSLLRPDKILLLDKIRRSNAFMAREHDSDELLTELFLNNQIILYENGDPWCDVNPLIRETVIRKAKLLVHAGTTDKG